MYNTYINDWPEQSNEWFTWLNQRKANQIAWGLLFSSCAIVKLLLGLYVVVLNGTYIFCWGVIHLVLVRRFGFQKYSNKYCFPFSELINYRFSMSANWAHCDLKIIYQIISSVTINFLLYFF